MKVYLGSRGAGGAEVYVKDGIKVRQLKLRLDLRDHSPTGFEWGYGGSGPAQLALAILADCLRSDREALRLYQRFKFSVVAALDHDIWSITERDVHAWHRAYLTAEGAA